MMNLQRRRRGFSLIELLIVIAIILIIITIALPKFSSAQRYAKETSALGAIRTIHTMQVQYYSQYGKYATSLTELGPPDQRRAESGGGGPDRQHAGQRREGRLQVHVKRQLRGLHHQRRAGRLRRQREPDILLGPIHGGPAEFRPGTGHGKQSGNEVGRLSAPLPA